MWQHVVSMSKTSRLSSISISHHLVIRMCTESVVRHVVTKKKALPSPFSLVKTKEMQGSCATSSNHQVKQFQTSSNLSHEALLVQDHQVVIDLTDPVITHHSVEMAKSKAI